MSERIVNHLKTPEKIFPLNRINESQTFNPELNIEREKYYFSSVETPSFRIWRSYDSVIIGKFLDPEKEVNLSLAKRLSIPVLARPSGGGAVFHDLGNINYSIYLPENILPAGRIEDWFQALSFPVLETLKYFGIPFTLEITGSILINGFKISGSAQAKSGEHFIHHGTLLVNTDLQRLELLLKRGGRSKCVPVINLSDLINDIKVEEVIEIMERTFQNSFFYCKGKSITSVIMENGLRNSHAEEESKRTASLLSGGNRKC